MASLDFLFVSPRTVFEYGQDKDNCFRISFPIDENFFENWFVVFHNHTFKKETAPVRGPFKLSGFFVDVFQ